MRRKFYRIAYRVVELGHNYTNDHVGEEDMAKYLELLRRRFPDANLIHAELMEEFERDDDESADVQESIILLG